MKYARLFIAAHWALILACGLTPSSALQGIPNPTLPTERAAVLQSVPEPRLFTIELPAGTTGTITVDWDVGGAQRQYRSSEWLSQGYDGVRFVGQGVGVTHLRPTEYGTTVYLGRHPGIVRFERMTVHAGHDRAIFAGAQNTQRTVTPEFLVWLQDCELVADPPRQTGVTQGQIAPHGGTLVGSGGHVAQNVKQGDTIPFAGTLTDSRTKWLWFSYQADFIFQRTTFDGKQAREHDSYAHGFARYGALVEDCWFKTAGAECLKFRPDVTETAPVAGTRIVVRRTRFADWYQDWSDRGGAAIVLQNATSDVLIEFCSFRPARKDQRSGLDWNALSHCIEIASEGETYYIEDEAGLRYGNGRVVIRTCAMQGRSEFAWSNPIVRCARNGGSWLSAQSFELTGSGVWGGGAGNVYLMLGEIPGGRSRVSGCNTPAIRAACRKLGFDVAAEAVWPGPQRLVPLSEGLVR